MTDLKANATRNAQALAAGHAFVIAMRDGYPINVLGRIREIPEMCSIFCATANPVEVIVAETEQGRGVLGVIDGSFAQGSGIARRTREWRHGLASQDRIQACDRLSPGVTDRFRLSIANF